MNTNELVQKFREEIKNIDINDSNRDLKIAIYVYTELGKIKSFDEKYFYGNAKTRKQIISRAKSLDKNVDEVAEKRKITCVSLSKLYITILKELGIKGEIIRPTIDDEHVYPILYLDEKGIIKADLQCDLVNIQTRSELKEFKYHNEFVDDESKKTLTSEIDQILIEQGYISDKSEYRDNMLRELKEELKEIPENERLNFILMNEQIARGLKDMEHIEIKKYYKAIIQDFFEYNRSKDIKIFSCYKQNENKEDRQFTILSYYLKKDEIQAFLYAKKQGKFVETNLDELIDLRNNGLVIGTNKRADGVKLLEKKLNEREKNNKKDIENEEER